MFKMAKKMLAIDGSSSSSGGGSSSKKSKHGQKGDDNNNDFAPPTKPKTTDELGDFSKLEDDPRLPLNVRQIFKITKSWKAIARTMCRTGTAMFLNLFEQNEDLFYLFDRFQHLKRNEIQESMELKEHAATVMSTLDQSISSLNDYDNFVNYLHSIGELHRKVPEFRRDHFWKIEEPFMKAVKQTLDERCNETIEEIYRIAIKLIIETIADGYGHDQDNNNAKPGSGAGGSASGSGSGSGGPLSDSQAKQQSRSAGGGGSSAGGGGGGGGGGSSAYSGRQCSTLATATVARSHRLNNGADNGHHLDATAAAITRAHKTTATTLSSPAASMNVGQEDNNDCKQGHELGSDKPTMIERPSCASKLPLDGLATNNKPLSFDNNNPRCYTGSKSKLNDYDHADEARRINQAGASDANSNQSQHQQAKSIEAGVASLDQAATDHASKEARLKATMAMLRQILATVSKDTRTRPIASSVANESAAAAANEAPALVGNDHQQTKSNLKPVSLALADMRQFKSLSPSSSKLDHALAVEPNCKSSSSSNTNQKNARRCNVDPNKPIKDSSQGASIAVATCNRRTMGLLDSNTTTTSDNNNNNNNENDDNGTEKQKRNQISCCPLHLKQHEAARTKDREANSDQHNKRCATMNDGHSARISKLHNSKKVGSILVRRRYVTRTTNKRQIAIAFRISALTRLTLGSRACVRRPAVKWNCPRRIRRRLATRQAPGHHTTSDYPGATVHSDNRTPTGAKSLGGNSPAPSVPPCPFNSSENYYSGKSICHLNMPGTSTKQATSQVDCTQLVDSMMQSGKLLLNDQSNLLRVQADQQRLDDDEDENCIRKTGLIEASLQANQVASSVHHEDDKTNGKQAADTTTITTIMPECYTALSIKTIDARQQQQQRPMLKVKNDNRESCKLERAPRVARGLRYCKRARRTIHRPRDVSGSAHTSSCFNGGNLINEYISMVPSSGEIDDATLAINIHNQHHSSTCPHAFDLVTKGNPTDTEGLQQINYTRNETNDDDQQICNGGSLGPLAPLIGESSLYQIPSLNNHAINSFASCKAVKHQCNQQKITSSNQDAEEQSITTDQMLVLEHRDPEISPNDVTNTICPKMNADQSMLSTNPEELLELIKILMGSLAKPEDISTEYKPPNEPVSLARGPLVCG